MHPGAAHALRYVIGNAGGIVPELDDHTRSSVTVLRAGRTGERARQVPQVLGSARVVADEHVRGVLAFLACYWPGSAGARAVGVS
jgi:hypothetical protein